MSARWMVFWAVVLLLAFGAWVSLTPTEAHFLAMIRDVTRLEANAPTDVLRALRANLSAVIQRADQPVYPLLLDGWTMLLGDSIRMSRLFSALISLIALALMLRLPLKSLQWGLVPISVIVGHLIGPYALLLLLSAASQLVLERTERRSRLFYGIILIVALYTDLSALLLIPLHAMLIRDVRHLRWLLIGIVIIPYWMLKPPTIDLITIAIPLLILALPALMTLWAARIDLKPRLALAGAFVVLIVYGITVIMRPDWPSTWAHYLAERDPRHPVIVAFPPESVPAAYDHDLQLRRGISVDLGWRDFTPVEIDALIARLTEHDQPVWVIMTTDDPQTDQVLRALRQTYHAPDPHLIGEFSVYRFTPK